MFLTLNRLVVLHYMIAHRKPVLSMYRDVETLIRSKSDDSQFVNGSKYLPLPTCNEDEPVDESCSGDRCLSDAALETAVALLYP